MAVRRTLWSTHFLVMVVFLTGCYQTNAQPQLTSYSLSMTPPESLILTFSAVVDATTCDGSMLTMHGTPTPQPDSAVNFVNASCNYPPGDSTGFAVMVVPSPDLGWMNVQGNILIATSASNTYISLGANFIQTTGSNPIGSLPTSTALMPTTFTLNFNPPSVMLAALFLGEGFVGIVFSEAIDLNTVSPMGVTINFIDRTTSSPRSLTLSGMANVGLLQGGVGAIVRIGLTPDDLNNLKFYSQAPYSFRLAANSFRDGNNMGNEQTSDLMFQIIAPDDFPPNLVQFDVDLNVGNLVLTFDEPMETANANISMLRLVSTFDAVGMGYNLNDSVIQGATNLNTILTVTISDVIQNAVKSDMGLCTDVSNCFLSTTGMTINDIAGNPLNSSVDVVAPGTYTPDTIAPTLDNYVIDLNTGMLTLEFSEPIDQMDFLPDGISISDSNRMGPVTLMDSMIVSTANFDRIFFITVEESVLSTIKMYQMAGGVLLTMTSNTATDYAGNQIVAIDNNSPLPPGNVVTDNTPPVLMDFEVGAPPQRQLILSFSEMVDITSFVPSSITLTFVSPILEETTFALTGGTPTSGAMDTVILTFTSSDLAMFMTQYDESYTGGSFRLTISAGAVADLSGNMLQAIARPLTFSNVPEYVEGFTLDLNFGLITITFTEPVDVDNIDYSGIDITGELKIAPSGYNISGGSVDFNNVNRTEITILMTRTSLNQIKFDMGVCTDISNCFLFLVPGSFQDDTGDQLFSIPVRYQVNEIFNDTTSPDIIGYSLNLQDGIIEFSFDEPMNPASFMPFYFTLSDSGYTQFITLDSAVVSSVSDMNTRITAELRSILNMVKVLSSSSSNMVVLTANESAITDVGGNSIAGISPPFGIQPTRLLIDTVPPTMINFMARPPSSRSFVMMFDEFVQPSSFDSSKLILTLNTRDGSVYTYGPQNFTGATMSPISDTITYMFSSAEFDSVFEALYTDAFYDGFIALTTEAGLIADLDLNLLPPINAPGLLSNNDSVIPDLRHPTLEGFTFDLNASRLVMTFSENVTLLLVTGQVTIQDLPVSPMNTYTLVSEGMSMVDNGVVTLILSAVDLNNIKNNPNIASSRGNTYLNLNQNFLQDLAGNPLDNSQGPIEPTVYITDTQGPSITSSSLNLDTGVLMISFTEPILSSEVRLDRISLTPMMQSSAGDVTMANQMFTATDNTVTITLVRDTLNQIKSTPSLCSSIMNCFLYVTELAFLDSNRNPLVAPSTSFALTMYTADSTPPTLESFTLDLSRAQITLMFSESILQSSLSPTQMRLANLAGDSVALGSASVDSVGSFDSTVTLMLSSSSLVLNRAKLYGIQGVANVFLYLTSGSVTDTSGNPIAAITSSNPLMAFQVIPDRIDPSLLGFSPGEPELNRLTFRFNEYVNASTWNGNNVITLTLSTPEGAFDYTDFTEGTVTPDISDVVWYNFGGSMLTDPFTTQYMRAYERGFIMLSRGTGIIQDIFGNSASGLSSPVTFMNVTVESVRPEIVSFTFDAVSGVLVMTFSEEVMVRTVVGNVVLQNLMNNPQVVYALTQPGSVATMGAVVTLTLSPTDQAALLNDPMIGTAVTDTYLRLDPDFLSDLNENQLLGRSAGLQASSVDAPSVDTTLQSFDLDMNIGQMELTFNNIIDISSVQSTSITIQSTATSDAVSLSLGPGSRPVGTMDGTTITISISTSDLNTLKSIANLATVGSNTYISFPATFAQNFLANPVTEIPRTSAMPVNTYVRDATPPMVTRFQLDMNSGSIMLSFDEPVSLNSVMANSLTVSNSFSGAVSYLLTGGDVSATATTAPTRVDVTMTTNDLNTIKANTNLATMQADSFLTVTMVADVSANSISSQTIQALTYQSDITPPTLMYFDLDLSSGPNAIINMQFNEPMTFNPTTTLQRITLQDAVSASMATVTLPLSQSAGDRLEWIPDSFTMRVTLRASYSTQLQSGQSIGSSVESLYMAVGQDAITDLSANSLPTINSAAARRVRYIYRNCMDGSYQNQETGTCVNCSSACVDGCSGFLPIAGVGGCDSCYVLLTFPNGTQDRCLDPDLVSDCPPGYYRSLDTGFSAVARTICQPCDENCALCNMSPNNCQACNSAISMVGGAIQCLADCSGSTSCDVCDSQCDGCTGPTNSDCVNCRGQSMTINSKTICVPACSSNQYLVEDPPGEYSCQNCHPDCNGCDGPTQADCISCRNVFEMRQGVKVCLTRCSGNSYTDAGECMACDAQCLGCTGSTNMDCLGCVAQSVMIGGQTACVRQCPSGQVLNTATGECSVDQTTVTIAVAVGVVVAVLVITVIIIMIISCVVYCRRRGVFDPNKRDDGPVLFIDAKLKESNIPVLDDYESSPL